MRAYLFAFLTGIGCAHTLTPTEMEDLAERKYKTEHMICVERYDTLQAIAACREDVRRRWGIVTVYPDAGAR